MKNRRLVTLRPQTLKVERPSVSAAINIGREGGPSKTGQGRTARAPEAPARAGGSHVTLAAPAARGPPTARQLHGGQSPGDPTQLGCARAPCFQLRYKRSGNGEAGARSAPRAEASNAKPKGPIHAPQPCKTGCPSAARGAPRGVKHRCSQRREGKTKLIARPSRLGRTEEPP